MIGSKMRKRAGDRQTVERQIGKPGHIPYDLSWLLSALGMRYGSPRHGKYKLSFTKRV